MKIYMWTASVWLRANHNGAYYSQRLRVFCYFVYKCFFCWLNVTKTCGSRYSLFILSGFPLIRDYYHIYNWLYHVNFNSHLRHEHESIHFPPMKTDWTMWFTFVQFFLQWNLNFHFIWIVNQQGTWCTLDCIYQSSRYISNDEQSTGKTKCRAYLLLYSCFAFSSSY